MVAGTNAGQAISGRGGCVTGIPGVTSESSWCIGQAPVALGSAGDRACFLTRMSGAFNGGGEHIETYVSNGQWYLGGGAGTNSVCASARCALNMPYSAETVWSQSDSSAHMLDVEAGRACFLTGVSGAYWGGGEIVAAYRQNGSWYIGGGSLQSGVSARARCLSF
jgi:hypothetical protein